jgi:hypothetical protein
MSKISVAIVFSTENWVACYAALANQIYVLLPALAKVSSLQNMQ